MPGRCLQKGETKCPSIIRHSLCISSCLNTHYTTIYWLGIIKSFLHFTTNNLLLYVFAQVTIIQTKLNTDCVTHIFNIFTVIIYSTTAKHDYMCKDYVHEQHCHSTVNAQNYTNQNTSKSITGLCSSHYLLNKSQLRLCNIFKNCLKISISESY